ncbi:MAG: hypothetical protein HFI52_14515 [Lachnospiraceae bacterium]|nr:hypothetical protein [Lachnospiraceae bacterium]MDE7019960.1 hypothetical protein [Lachnospiraceae bacterium]
MSAEMISGMQQVVDSMEYAVKMRSQARAERRAEEAEQEKKAFMEKLRQAEATKTELDSQASKAKGTQDAVVRDQLMGLMMAGF